MENRGKSGQIGENRGKSVENGGNPVEIRGNSGEMGGKSEKSMENRRKIGEIGRKSEVYQWKFEKNQGKTQGTVEKIGGQSGKSGKSVERRRKLVEIGGQRMENVWKIGGKSVQNRATLSFNLLCLCKRDGDPLCCRTLTGPYYEEITANCPCGAQIERKKPVLPELGPGG